jgi:hypothetical protein
LDRQSKLEERMRELEMALPRAVPLTLPREEARIASWIRGGKEEL